MIIADLHDEVFWELKSWFHCEELLRCNTSLCNEKQQQQQQKWKKTTTTTTTKTAKTTQHSGSCSIMMSSYANLLLPSKCSLCSSYTQVSFENLLPATQQPKNGDTLYDLLRVITSNGEQVYRAGDTVKLETRPVIFGKVLYFQKVGKKNDVDKVVVLRQPEEVRVVNLYRVTPSDSAIMYQDLTT